MIVCLIFKKAEKVVVIGKNVHFRYEVTKK